MTFRIVIRSIAYLVFVITLLATANAPNRRQHQPATLGRSLPSTDEAALARCKALGTAAPRDSACTAAWRASRERFLNDNPSGPASAGANRAGLPQ